MGDYAITWNNDEIIDTEETKTIPEIYHAKQKMATLYFLFY